MVVAQPRTFDSSASFASFGFSQSTAAYVRPTLVHFEVSEPPLTQIALFGPIAPGWELVQFLTVAIEKDQDDDYLMSDDEFLVYGTGETLTQAHQDYITSLIEYYQLLSQHKDRPTQSLFRHLQSYLRPFES